MKNGTNELLQKLKKTDDIYVYLKAYEDDMITTTTGEFLNFHLAESGLRIADIAKETGLMGYTYRIFNNERRVSRDPLLAVAIAMELTLEDTQILLRIARHPALDPRIKRVVFLIFAVENHLDVQKTNELLYSNKERLL